MRRRGYWIAWVDLLSTLLATTLLVAQLERTKAEADQARGEVRIELHWADGLTSDVDLWVLCPGDLPVGYSNKTGGVCTLDRDDLGSFNDMTPYNFETARARGVPAGEYVINAHLFRYGDADPLPLPVTVAVYVALPSGGTSQILTRTAELTAMGEERTIVRFSLDGKGGLVPGSVGDLDLPLRSAK